MTCFSIVPSGKGTFVVSGTSLSGHEISETILGITLRSSRVECVPPGIKIIRLFDVDDICHEYVLPHDVKTFVWAQGQWRFEK